MKEILRRMGCGPFFMAWVDQIYAYQEGEIILVGSRSRRFLLHKGVRQGCPPLSPLLFNIVMAVLASLVRQTKDIRGIQNSTIEHKILLFADDPVCVLGDPESSLKAMQWVLTQFGTVSGYKINEAKSTILGLNIEPEIKQTIKEWAVVPWKTKVRCLGVNIGIPLDLNSPQGIKFDPCN